MDCVTLCCVIITQFNFNSIQFYCKIGMTERSQWTEYKINNQIYKQRTAEHNRLRQTVMSKYSPSMYMHTQIMPSRSFCTTCGRWSCSPKGRLNVQEVDMMSRAVGLRGGWQWWQKWITACVVATSCCISDEPCRWEKAKFRPPQLRHLLTDRPETQI